MTPTTSFPGRSTVRPRARQCHPRSTERTRRGYATRALQLLLPYARAEGGRSGSCYVEPVIRQIAPQFFTTDMPATLAYYQDALGFACLATWNDPPVYAIVVRDGHRIHFRFADPPTPSPDKYADELLDAYLFVEDADALHAEYAARGVEFTRALGDTPW